MDELIAGIHWLAEGGRSAARAFQEGIEDDEQLSAAWDEAVEWLKDIAEGKEL